MANHPKPPMFAESTRLFLLGIVKRFYYLIFAFLLDPLDLFNKWVSPHLPVGYRVTIDISITWFWIAFGLMLTLSAALTYHELRKQQYVEVGGIRSAYETTKNRNLDLEFQRTQLEIDKRGLTELVNRPDPRLEEAQAWMMEWKDRAVRIMSNPNNHMNVQSWVQEAILKSQEFFKDEVSQRLRDAIRAAPADEQQYRNARAVLAWIDAEVPGLTIDDLCASFRFSGKIEPFK